MQMIGNNPCNANGELGKAWFSEFAKLSIQEFLDRIARKAGLQTCPKCHTHFAYEQQLLRHTC
jgi:hypothetical protein